MAYYFRKHQQVPLEAECNNANGDGDTRLLETGPQEQLEKHP